MSTSTTDLGTKVRKNMQNLVKLNKKLEDYKKTKTNNNPDYKFNSDETYQELSAKILTVKSKIRDLSPTAREKYPDITSLPDNPHSLQEIILNAVVEDMQEGKMYKDYQIDGLDNLFEQAKTFTPVIKDGQPSITTYTLDTEETAYGPEYVESSYFKLKGNSSEEVKANLQQFVNQIVDKVKATYDSRIEELEDQIQNQQVTPDTDEIIKTATEIAKNQQSELNPAILDKISLWLKNKDGQSALRTSQSMINFQDEYESWYNQLLGTHVNSVNNQLQPLTEFGQILLQNLNVNEANGIAQKNGLEAFQLTLHQKVQEALLTEQARDPLFLASFHNKSRDDINRKVHDIFNSALDISLSTLSLSNAHIPRDKWNVQKRPPNPYQPKPMSIADQLSHPQTIQRAIYGNLNNQQRYGTPAGYQNQLSQASGQNNVLEARYRANSVQQPQPEYNQAPTQNTTVDRALESTPVVTNNIPKPLSLQINPGDFEL